MPQRKHRFQAPPSQDPLSGAKSSLVFRLNFGFFFRQLVIFLVMDLLLLFMATAGLFLYAENRCATVAALVEERGVPLSLIHISAGEVSRAAPYSTSSSYHSLVI